MSHFLTTPLRSLLQTITSSIFGRAPDRSSAKKHGRDDGSEREQSKSPQVAGALVTPSVTRPKKRRRKIVIATSDSCHTLVDLSRDPKEALPSPSQIEQRREPLFRRTQIRLPADECDYDVEEDEDEYCCGCVSPAKSSVEERLHLPVVSSDLPVDRYLSGLPAVVESAEMLLAEPAAVLSLAGCSGIKVLSVFQGEIGHCTPSQADVVVSDRATTCHIVAMRSTARGEGGGGEALVSLCHVDRAGFKDCLRGAARLHRSHHRSAAAAATEDLDDEEKKCEDEDAAVAIGMDLHILGGYSDPNGTSLTITRSLLDTFADIADEEAARGVTITLKTCAVGRMNDDRIRGGPIGRGLALDTASGEVYLAKVDATVAGPMTSARAARLWANSGGDAAPRLSCVSVPSACEIAVRPFEYEAFPEIDPILSLKDEVLLQYTSTSPDVEEEDFCDSVRRTLRFMRDVKATEVFGPGCQTPVVWRRRMDDVNRWEVL